MGHRYVCRNAEEHDLVTGWRKVLCYMGRPGVTHRIKKWISRRLRREARAGVRALSREMD